MNAILNAMVYQIYNGESRSPNHFSAPKHTLRDQATTATTAIGFETGENSWSEGMPGRTIIGIYIFIYHDI